LHRDPFTLRCYSKPRGYAADAPALDYVLRARELAVRSSDPVSALHHFMTHGETARALCFRRDAIAREIDKAAEGAALPLCVFAAGCGRLRECDHIRPSTPQRLGKLVAFDMDAENLAGLKRDYPELPILTHQGSVRQLVDGKHLFGDMDLVYCSGLMEALPQAAALGLSRALFAMLRPGGSLVITCFTHGLAEAGYLEAFMDWRMVYRTPVEIVDLAKAIASDEISGWTYRESPEATLGVLRVTRR
jgi:SAM-dependent methyltransferase